MWTLFFCSFKNCLVQVNAQIDLLNTTTDWNESVSALLPNNSTETLRNSTVPDGEGIATEASDDVNATQTESRGPGGSTAWATERVSPTTDATPPTARRTAGTAGPATSSPSQPLPLSGSLPPPVTNSKMMMSPHTLILTLFPLVALITQRRFSFARLTVSSACPCDLAEGQCDVNCCCDASCDGEAPLFTDCSVQLLIGDERLCSRDAVRYSLRAGADGVARVHASVQQEGNADVFCVHRVNCNVISPHTLFTAVTYTPRYTTYTGSLIHTSVQHTLSDSRQST
uniref:Tectonic-1-3 N-terminal domain-containing protein n=1 Tax=Scleropages formosus TaxID=113540 RepID=A0A8C9TMG9_SCLFO